ncbi:methyltransferase domain-containing protein [uncultured Williamsia sp.]|uniref:class I SAM-dependent methyltransferase n=1 Tax=uncultured Williamsia sp. TaxID=259311 RepID=UPI0026226094|nr:methyltransferase domain-containing protein [uncultured Williamsia sp.]
MTKYTASARFYDLISAEWPVYRAGRVRGIAMAGIRGGDHVVDIGCGTGLNFSLLQDAVGPSGHITGIDSSEQMLAQARRRSEARGWSNVTLVQGDATSSDVDGLPDHADVVLATYAVSLMPEWPRAIDVMLRMATPGGTVVLVDMQEPTGAARIWTPLARLACALGGSDITAHPWTQLEERATDVRSAAVRGGHIQIRVGHVPS